LVSIPDVGKAVNPQAVEGQVEGAAVQGMGYALMEESKIDRGVLKTVDLATYLIPSIKDAPEIEVIPVEQGEDTGPFGAKGVGEIGIIPVAPAVANAIHDAVAVRATSLPITPEKLYWPLKQQRPQEAAPPSPSH
jgi:CO/xanthine dehydrogenase Mo-binding subunit